MTVNGSIAKPVKRYPLKNNETDIDIIMVKEHFFESRETLVSELTQYCMARINKAIEERGHATVMLSGGSTPADLYAAMSHENAAWDKVTAALVDERWVDYNHDKSNEQFVTTRLKANQAEAVTIQGMKNSHEKAVAGVADCEQAYQALQAPWAFTILGMGPDGHTASLFPQAPGLAEALALDNDGLCTAINAHQSSVTGEFTERMTLTLGGILHTDDVILLITGEDKLKVYQEALQAENNLNSPVSAVLKQDKLPVTVFWAP